MTRATLIKESISLVLAHRFRVQSINIMVESIALCRHGSVQADMVGAGGNQEETGYCKQPIGSLPHGAWA